MNASKCLYWGTLSKTTASLTTKLIFPKGLQYQNVYALTFAHFLVDFAHASGFEHINTIA
jgi:hypothetical protein